MGQNGPGPSGFPGSLFMTGVGGTPLYAALSDGRWMRPRAENADRDPAGDP
ncbi:hypothetical protein ACFY5H_04860 [Streptomyces sp. NPDC013012]|uniref:hypothetical protein n=1 Tax=Streptomyces sp. NPDC013012 TaxID=3364860 RepID=UPI0036B601C9